jgi:hypothetical protein
MHFSTFNIHVPLLDAVNDCEHLEFCGGVTQLSIDEHGCEIQKQWGGCFV